jgi:hypothetical protein
MSERVIIVLLLGLGMAGTRADAEVVTVFDYSQWQSLADAYTTIDFTGFPDATPITDQYGALGVIVAAPAFIFASNGLVNDGWGLHGPSGLHLFYDTPQRWIAVHHAANAEFELYFEGELVGMSGFDPIGGIGSFLGIVSTVPFDEVIITKPPFYGTHIIIDDLHWGSSIPAPPCLLIFSGLARRRRRD